MTLKHGPHSYKLLREEPYTRKMDGVETVLLVWEGHCADCGEAFETKTPKDNTHADQMVRRCEIHRHPGKRAGRRP